MLLDASQIPPDTVVETDICIVGGGAAGITLAREFLGQSNRVCLLESGGLQPEPETQALYKGDIVGHSYYDLETARLRYFGGTSNHWAGNCRALSRIDFEERDWIPHSGWPFDVQHLTPFYERAQKILQIGPFAYEAKDWATPEAGPLQFADDAVVTRVTQFSPPTRFGVAYGEEIKNATNVTAYLHANLVDIETNESNQSVTRLAIATLAGARFWVKAKHYVLATGGIENARLLLCANRVQKTGLGNEHGLVGRFFMEHLSLDVGLFLPSNQDLSRLDFYEVPDRRLGQVVTRPPATKAYLAFSEAVQRRDRITNVTATLNRVYLPPSHESPGYLGLKDLMSGGTENGFWQDLRNVIADFDSMASGMYWKQFERDRPIRLLTVHVQAEQAPNPESRVFLGTERDRLEMPRVKLDWRLTPLDVSSLRRVPEILGVQFGRSGLGRLKVIIPAEDAKLVASVGGDWHHMGTTRMHRDPKQGVVDADCRVHGIRNLFIAGSSVFPTGGHSVPTLTIVAMSVRLADHLKQAAAA